MCGPQQKRIKDVSMAAWREKRECEKERAIVYMFEKRRLTWLKKEREGEGGRGREKDREFASKTEESKVGEGGWYERESEREKETGMVYMSEE